MTYTLSQRLFDMRLQLAILAALLIVVIAALYFAPQEKAAEEDTPPLPLGETIRSGAAPIPPLSTSTQQKLEKMNVFHALVSYTDGGFEPRETTIKKGETVRFANNSSREVWIAPAGSEVQIYPRTQDTCGSSDLDSCEPFNPQDFWQFTFDHAGEWVIVNNLDKEKSGKVIVE